MRTPGGQQERTTCGHAAKAGIRSRSARSLAVPTLATGVLVAGCRESSPNPADGPRGGELPEKARTAPAIAFASGAALDLTSVSATWHVFGSHDRARAPSSS
jgi:hypothetical protein